MANIVIIGGHGKIALLLTPLLRQRGDTVTSIIRNPEQTADVTAAGAQPTVLNVENATCDELAEAFAGADAIAWSAGAGGKGGKERTYAVDRDAAIRTMQAAQQAGVKRYLMVSFNGSKAPLRIPAHHPLYHYAVAKLDADKHLVGTDLEWTILGPSTLTDQEPTGAITVSDLTEGGSKDTSRANVAQVAAAALETPSTIRRVIPFVDGDTPIDQAIANVPREYSHIS